MVSQPAGGGVADAAPEPDGVAPAEGSGGADNLGEESSGVGTGEPGAAEPGGPGGAG